MNYQYGPGPLQDEHDKLKADIAIVEDGDTAVHAIANGQYVIWKNDLYVAKADISIGTALSSSNLTAKTKGLGDELRIAKESLDEFKDIGFRNMGTTVGKVTKYVELTSGTGGYCILIAYAQNVNYIGMWLALIRPTTSSSNGLIREILAPGSNLTVSMDSNNKRVQITSNYSSTINFSWIPLASAKRSSFALVSE